MNNMMLGWYCHIQAAINTFGKDKRGVTAIEYALIAVAMATLLAFILGNKSTGFLGALNDAFKNITDAITSVTTSS